MKTDNISRLVALIIAISICLARAYAEDNRYCGDLPIYNIDGIAYTVQTELPQDGEDVYLPEYLGAYVLPNDDKSVKYSGKIDIPSQIVIDGEVYPVVGFIKLSEYGSDCESEDLEINLPEGIKVIGSNLISQYGRPRTKVKFFNIPNTVEYIIGMEYYVENTTVVIPKSVKSIGYAAGVYGDNLTIEDGVTFCGMYSISCRNKTLTLPGSVYMYEMSTYAPNLELLSIKKSADSNASPSFALYCFRYSYNIASIVCEYDVPPMAVNDAFRLEPSIDDPKYPGDDNVDGYNPGMYDRATLYVPKAAVEAYKADAEWGRFEKILAIEDNADIIKKLEGVDDISADAAEVVATEYYDLSGRRLAEPAERGITITATTYSDGTRRCTKTVR